MSHYRLRKNHTKNTLADRIQTRFRIQVQVQVQVLANNHQDDDIFDDQGSIQKDKDSTPSCAEVARKAALKLANVQQSLVCNCGLLCQQAKSSHTSEEVNLHTTGMTEIDRPWCYHSFDRHESHDLQNEHSNTQDTVHRIRREKHRVGIGHRQHF
jgi:hypothetical protein